MTHLYLFYVELCLESTATRIIVVHHPVVPTLYTAYKNSITFFF